MKSKVILVNLATQEETLVATVKSSVEAFQFASLLQAMVVSENYIYYVDHFIKGKGGRRSQPDSFASMVNNSTHLTNLLKINRLVS
jgi:hypothetical protein